MPIWCDFCEFSSHNVADCIARGAARIRNGRRKSTVTCRPKTLTREQFLSLATPLLDEQAFLKETLDSPILQNLMDGYVAIPHTLDTVQGTVFAEIVDGIPIGCCGLYNGIIRNVSVRKEFRNQGIGSALVKQAIDAGAVWFEDSFTEDIGELFYDLIYFPVMPSEEPAPEHEPEPESEVEIIEQPEPAPWALLVAPSPKPFIFLNIKHPEYIEHDRLILEQLCKDLKKINACWDVQ